MIISVVPLVRLPVGVGPFSYTASEDHEIVVGSLVTIPFRSRTKLGIVVDCTTGTAPTDKPLQPVTTALSPIPLVSEGWCASLLRLATVYHVNPGTMAISMLPSIGPRMVKAATLPPLAHAHAAHGTVALRHTIVDRGADVDEALIAQVRAFPESTCVIICPESSTVDRIIAQCTAAFPGKNIRAYTRAGSAKDVKAIWHRVRVAAPDIIVGTRAAALLPFAPETQVLVVHPQDDSHTQWDGQPHTTTLDVLMIRARSENLRVTTFAHTATTEQLLEKEAWTRAWNPEPLTFESIDNAQLVRARLYHAIPDPVRDALAQATSEHPAVILVNRTDASVVLRCAECETIIASRTATECPQCHGTTLHSRGMSVEYLARMAAEAFPAFHTGVFTSETTDVPPDAQIIVATDSILYHSVLARASIVWAPSADARFGRLWYRTVEDALYYFRELTFRAPTARLLLSTWKAEHPLWAALRDTDALRRFFAHELQSRKKHHYPPYIRLIRVNPGPLSKTTKSAITSTTRLVRLPMATWIDELCALTPQLAREDRVEPNPLSP